MNLTSVAGQEDSVSALQRIRENIDRVLRLIMGFLDASKGESGEDHRMETPVALTWSIHEVVRDESINMLNNGITLDLNLYPNLPEIIGEVLRLERVLWNLIINAIKFTPRGGKITVTTETANGQVCVRVGDMGVGISEEELPLLFSEYRRFKRGRLDRRHRPRALYREKHRHESWWDRQCRKRIG